ncbi:hypothetical protein Nos7524_2832 [Nostoc sp. PCC 7524]|nr:hypothetical protein Nos7524_2832 [Nostoc sp. PCC 7524]
MTDVFRSGFAEIQMAIFMIKVSYDSVFSQV